MLVRPILLANKRVRSSHLTFDNKSGESEPVQLQEISNWHVSGRRGAACCAITKPIWHSRALCDFCTLVDNTSPLAAS
jgi:hypothetical protein